MRVTSAGCYLQQGGARAGGGGGRVRGTSAGGDQGGLRVALTHACRCLALLCSLLHLRHRLTPNPEHML